MAIIKVERVTQLKWTEDADYSASDTLPVLICKSAN
jgi:hypothetical protein